MDTVYCVFLDNPEGRWLEAVYETRELAQKHVKKHPTPGLMQIDPWVVRRAY